MFSLTTAGSSQIQELQRVYQQLSLQREQAIASGVEEVRITEILKLREAQVEAQTMFIEASLRITARGRPRITT